MTYYSDDWLTILEGDCREVMATMEPESVHCVVTSPPYWGLRDYGTATWLGGDEGCDHLNGPLASPASTLMGYTGPDVKLATGGMPFKDTCGKCGAIRKDSQLGLEPSPEAYVESMVAVFREVRRVLRADGTVWLNLGDSYAAGPMTERERAGERSGGTLNGRYGHVDNVAGAQRRSPVPSGLKPKDLVGIPWRVAFALQADGWYLRSDIIWSKPNPMPESVTDRPTKAHEYLFLLSKSPRYYYDADAVRETFAEQQGRLAVVAHDPDRYRGRDYKEDESAKGRSSRLQGPATNPAGRNLRSVWSIATQPYPGAHFATFPEKLVEPCVLAGTSAKGVCPDCGAPWVREVELTPEYRALLDSGKAWRTDEGKPDSYTNRQPKAHPQNVPPKNVTTGWRPDCRCEHDGGGWVPVPATILDPFAGSGTVGRVAARLSRRAILIDLNADYLGQAMKRNQDIPLGLETVG